VLVFISCVYFKTSIACVIFFSTSSFIPENIFLEKALPRRLMRTSILFQKLILINKHDCLFFFFLIIQVKSCISKAHGKGEWLENPLFQKPELQNRSLSVLPPKHTRKNDFSKDCEQSFLYERACYPRWAHHPLMAVCCSLQNSQCRDLMAVCCPSKDTLYSVSSKIIRLHAMIPSLLSQT
jgi:hypothetical protein